MHSCCTHRIYCVCAQTLEIYNRLWIDCSLIPRPIPSFSMLHAATLNIEKLGMGLGTRLQSTHNLI